MHITAQPVGLHRDVCRGGCAWGSCGSVAPVRSSIARPALCASLPEDVSQASTSYSGASHDSRSRTHHHHSGCGCCSSPTTSKQTTRRAAQAVMTPPQSTPLVAASAMAVAIASVLGIPGTSWAEDPAATAAAATAAVEAGKYVPSPYQPGWEIWVGFAAGVIPFAIGSYEFGKRILIQLRCPLCAGRGLVPSTRAGTKYLRKCPQCGGFFPWISWQMFLTSNATPGNGGPLQQPKGQRSVLYEVPPEPTPEDIAAARAKYFGSAAVQEAGEPASQSDTVSAAAGKGHDSSNIKEGGKQ